MSVSEALQAGFALAATIARDTGAKHAHIGLAREVSDAWCGLARDLERESRAERRVHIASLARMRATLRPRSRAAIPLSPRALALLATYRRYGRPGKPSPATTARPGYRSEPELLTLLSRIARRASQP